MIQQIIGPGQDLKQAVDNFPKEGGVLQLLPGEYSIDEVVEVPSNLTINGAGQNITVLVIKEGGRFVRKPNI